MLCNIQANAQKLSADKVPANVKAKFAALYPKITEVKWEMEKSDYEAGFTQDKTQMSVVIDAKGELKETETAIEVSALPKATTDYLAKTYPNVVFLIVGDEDGHNPRSVTQDYIKNFETN